MSVIPLTIKRTLLITVVIVVKNFTCKQTLSLETGKQIACGRISALPSVGKYFVCSFSGRSRTLQMNGWHTIFWTIFPKKVNLKPPVSKLNEPIISGNLGIYPWTKYILWVWSFTWTFCYSYGPDRFGTKFFNKYQ